MQWFEYPKHESSNIIYGQHNLAIGRWFCCDIPPDYNNDQSSVTAIDFNNRSSPCATSHDRGISSSAESSLSLRANGKKVVLHRFCFYASHLFGS